MNYNKVLIAGNLTRDPEMRYTPKGTALTKLSLACNRDWKDESGEKKEEVTFVDVTAWGKTAETIAQYFKKGKPIFIEGRLTLETWDDKQSGQKRRKLGVTCDSFSFVGGDKKQSDSTPAAPAEPVSSGGDTDSQIPF